MKKIIAVLIAGTFVIGTAVAQSGTAPTSKPVAQTVKTTEVKKAVVEKKEAAGAKKSTGKRQAHKSVKSKKIVAEAPKTK